MVPVCDKDLLSLFSSDEAWSNGLKSAMNSNKSRKANKIDTENDKAKNDRLRIAAIQFANRVVCYTKQPNLFISVMYHALRVGLSDDAHEWSSEYIAGVQNLLHDLNLISLQETFTFVQKHEMVSLKFCQNVIVLHYLFK